MVFSNASTKATGAIKSVLWTELENCVLPRNFETLTLLIGNERPLILDIISAILPKIIPKKAGILKPILFFWNKIFLIFKLVII